MNWPQETRNVVLLYSVKCIFRYLEPRRRSSQVWQDRQTDRQRYLAITRFNSVTGALISRHVETSRDMLFPIVRSGRITFVVKYGRVMFKNK